MKAALFVAVTLLVAALPTARAAEGVDLYGDSLPSGAIARLGTIRYRHPGWHKRVAFLPDSDTLLVGTDENTVRSWNARTGELIHDLDLEGDSLQAFCLSADGRVAATLTRKMDFETRGMRQRLMLWNAVSWRQLQQFTWNGRQLPAGQASVLAFSSDKQLIAAGTEDGIIIIWNAETGEELVSRRPVQGFVTSLAFSPTGNLLAVAEREGVLVWGYPGEEAPTTLAERPNGAQAVCFSPDGALLAFSGGDDERPALVYDVDSRRQLPDLQSAGADYYPDGLAFSADGRRLFVPPYRRHSVEIFDPRTGKLLDTWDAGRVDVGAVAASPDGKLIAGVGSDAIVVWDAETGERLGDQFVGHVETPYELAFTPDGQRVVTGSKDGTIRIWDAASGRQERLLQHEHWVAALALSPDGSRLVSCGLDDTVRLWDMATGAELFKLRGHGRTGGNITHEVTFSPDAAKFYSFGADMVLRAYSTDTGQTLAEHALQPSGFAAAEGAAGKPQVAGNPFAAFGEGGFSLESAQFTPDASQLLIGGRMVGAIHAFAVNTGQEVAVIKPEAPLQDFIVSRDGRFLATFEQAPVDPVANDHRESPAYILRLRDMTSHEIIAETALPGSYAHQVAYSPSGKLLACAVSLRNEQDPTILRRLFCIYDATTLQLVAQIEDPLRAPTHMAFSPDDIRMATAHQDTTVTVWDLKQFRVDATP